MKITTLLTVVALAFTVSVASAQSTKETKKEGCKKECVEAKKCTKAKECTKAEKCPKAEKATKTEKK